MSNDRFLLVARAASARYGGLRTTGRTGKRNEFMVGKALKLGVIAVACASLSACGGGDRLVADTGIGVSTVRSGCPAVAIPDHTGDITIFDPPAARFAANIDVVANITNLRSTCNEEGAKIYTEATFDVQASRLRPEGARQVTIPYFSTIVRGTNQVVAKRVGSVTLNFAPGEYRAQASAKAGSFIDASAARLPEEVIQKITKRRKPGDPDAALDPMADPEVKRAVSNATFEQLVGFQLTMDQLQYNATR